MNGAAYLYSKVEAELAYMKGMLEYIVDRILSTDIATTSTAWHNGCIDDHSTISIR